MSIVINRLRTLETPGMLHATHHDELNSST